MERVAADERPEMLPYVNIPYSRLSESTRAELASYRAGASSVVRLSDDAKKKKLLIDEDIARLMRDTLSRGGSQDDVLEYICQHWDRESERHVRRRIKKIEREQGWSFQTLRPGPHKRSDLLRNTPLAPSSSVGRKGNKSSKPSKRTRTRKERRP